jgi:hypothetical protein
MMKTGLPASGCPLPPVSPATVLARFPFVTMTMIDTRRPGSVDAGEACTIMPMSALLFAMPVTGAGLAVQEALNAFTLVPAFPSRHAKVGPVLPLLSEQAWIKAPAIRRSPMTSRVPGRTPDGRCLTLGGDSLASMILAP